MIYPTLRYHKLDVGILQKIKGTYLLVVTEIVLIFYQINKREFIENKK